MGLVVVVGGDADRLDHPDVELARHDRRRDEAAAGDRDDGVERAGGGEAPGERPGVAVELVPRDRKGLVAGGGHGRGSLAQDGGVGLASRTGAARAGGAHSQHLSPGAFRLPLSLARRPAPSAGDTGLAGATKNKKCTKGGSRGRVALSKGSNRMPGLATLPNAACALSLPARLGGAPSRFRDAALCAAPQDKGGLASCKVA